MAHRIRLRKPWTRHDFIGSPLVANNSIDESDLASQSGLENTLVCEVDVPDLEDVGSERTDSLADDQQSGRAHQATYSRRFNRPSGMEVSDRMQLEVGQIAGRLVDIRINSKTIANFTDNQRDAVERYDITADLAEHNALEIEIQAGDGKPRLRGAVNLWIVSQS